MANTLFLRLETPLQSWGERGHWSIRDTALEPTKSGVVGLLACALGWRDDERIRSLSQRLQIGVRCDHMGLLTQLVDYHTVGGGYPTPMLLTAAGKPKISNNRPHTEQTWRSYLCDTSFLVAMQTRAADPELIAMLAAAVQSPVWPVYLGRKACVPTVPIYAGLGDHDSLQSALESIGLRTGHALAQEVARVRAVLECEPQRKGGVMRRDHLASRKYWRHEPRYSVEVLLNVRVNLPDNKLEVP